MNQVTTYRWSFEEDLLAYQDAGYDGVGVWLRKLRDFGEERAIELVIESGLEVTSLSWVGGFTGADMATSRENLAEAYDAIDLAAELRAGCLVVHPGGRNGHTKRHAERLLRSALDRLLPHAERMGAVLALEPMHPAAAAGWTLLTDLRQTLSLIREYESPALRMALDSYHFPLVGAEPAHWRELVRQLAVVHLGDAARQPDAEMSRTPIGDGRIPLDTFVGGLREAGYEGPLEAKLIGPDIETLDYDGLLAHSRDALVGLAAPHATTPATQPDACNATS